jgi:hypothetical protein
MHNVCVVFVCNKNYFDKFIKTCSQLISRGEWKGDICLVIGDDLVNDKMLECDFITNLYKTNNFTIKHFPDINFSQDFLNLQKILNRPSEWVKKIFQFHKFYLFNVWFKKWDYIVYLDCGITIYSNIQPMLCCMEANTMLAHSDAYPGYHKKLSCQFDRNKSEHFNKLANLYNIEVDYFQTTIMLYSTDIIEETTYDNLVKLLLEYPISITNDQGIISLYYSVIKPHFKQIKINDGSTYFYDYLSRNRSYQYIMLKMG